MLRLLADENFNGDIVRGLLLRHRTMNILRVQDLSLMGQSDAQVLDWAARDDRIVLTHDRATMPSHAAGRVAAGFAMAGVFVMHHRLRAVDAIDELLLLDACSEQFEWTNVIAYLPL